jgi:hypothetical protein
MSRFPFRIPRLIQSRHSSRSSILTPRVEEKYWSHLVFRSRTVSSARLPECSKNIQFAKREPRRRTRNVCRSLRAVPPPGSQGPPRSGVSGSTTRTPASLKGLLTRRISSYLVFVLADEYNRPDCQRATAWVRPASARPIQPQISSGGSILNGCGRVI